MITNYKYSGFGTIPWVGWALKNPKNPPGYIPGAGLAKIAGRPVYIPGAGLKAMYIAGLKEKQAQLQRYHECFNKKTAMESKPTYAAGGSNWNPGNWAANIGLLTQRGNTNKINANIKKYNDRQIQNNPTGIKPDGTFVNFNYGGEGILTDHNGYAKSLKPVFDPSLNDEQRKYVTNNLRGMHIMGGWTDVDGRHKKFTGELPYTRSGNTGTAVGKYLPPKNEIILSDNPALSNIQSNRNVTPHELIHWQQGQQGSTRVKNTPANLSRLDVNADAGSLDLQPYVDPNSRMTPDRVQWVQNAVDSGKDRNQYRVPKVPPTDPNYFTPYRVSK